MQSFNYLVFFIAIFFTFSNVHSKKPVDESHCEGKTIYSMNSHFHKSFLLVCIKTITTFADGLPDSEKSSPDKIDDAFKKFCKKVKVDTKEHRLVRYLINHLFLYVFI
jgi:hypothetical protein